MKIIIVGAGEIGRILANMFTSEKNEVILVESDEEQAKKVAGQTECLVIKGDASDIKILNDAGASDADAIVIVTGDDKTNLMVSEIAKSLNIKRIITKVNFSKNEELFKKLDITAVIPEVGMMVTAIRRLLMRVPGHIIAEIGDGEVEVIEFKIAEKSHLVGKEAVIKGAVIGTIYRNGELIIPTPKTKLKAGDVILVSTTVEDLPEISKLIKGE